MDKDDIEQVLSLVEGYVGSQDKGWPKRYEDIDPDIRMIYVVLLVMIENAGTASQPVKSMVSALYNAMNSSSKIHMPPGFRFLAEGLRKMESG